MVSIVKQNCGFVLIQSTDKDMLKNTSFHLETRARPVEMLGNLDNEGRPSLDADFSISREELPKVYNTSQSCFIVGIKGEPHVVTSGAICVDLLKGNLRESLVNDSSVFINSVSLNAQFNLTLEGYNEPFVELLAQRIIVDPDVIEFFTTLKQKSFTFRNTPDICPSLDSSVLRNSSILLLSVKDPKHRAAFAQRIISPDNLFSTKIPQQGQYVTSISSPFGILSQELYLNNTGQGVVANVFEIICGAKSQRWLKHILMVDMINYGGKEGGVLLDEEYRVIAFILPSFIVQGSNPVYFSFALSARTVLNLVQENPPKGDETVGILPIPTIETTMARNVCLIKTASGHFSGVLMNNRGYIISVRHGLETRSLSKIIAYVDGFTEPFDVEVICVSSGDFDLSLLRLMGDLSQLQVEDLTLPHSLEAETIKIGDKVISVGFGVVHPTRQPQISRGLISKIISTDTKINVLVQTDTRIQNGCSGGAIFKGHQLIGTVLFNLRHQRFGNICDLNFALHRDVLQPLITAIAHEIPHNEIEVLPVWTHRNEQVRMFQTLQTTEKVPQFFVSPRL